MGALTELGLNTTDGPIMCVAAPDSVLAEAASMKPRPSFASTLVTAEPTARLLWWPEKQHLEPQTLERLRWLVEVANGQCWLILDGDEGESPNAAELVAALQASGLGHGTAIALAGGEVAIPVRSSPVTRVR